MNSKQQDRAINESALFDGENLDKVELNEESLAHMQNWSLIGATLRQEVSAQVNLDFANSIMSKIEKEQIVPDAAPEIKEMPISNFKMAFKKFAFGLGQVAIAASVAAVTIIGYQTINAEKSTTPSVATTALGSVEGVNLASYQTTRSDKTLKFEEKLQGINQNNNKVNNAELKKQQTLEVERINNYIRGYVFDTASN